MKILIVIGLAAIILLVAGYGGVMSIEKSIDAGSANLGDVAITQVAALNESEHVECVQNESDSDAVVVVQKEAQSDSITLGGVVFQTSLESGNIMAKTTGKPIFIYLHSKSCGWCKKFEEEVLTNNEVTSALNKSFISVVVEVNEQKKVASNFNVRGTPTMVFLDATGNEIDRIRGFVDAETFAQNLEKVNNILRSDNVKTS